MLWSPVCAQAKGTEKLSKTKIVTCKEETETLHLHHPSQKVKWSVSDRSVLKITKRSGWRRSTITFQTKKAGKAVIKAKVGSKVYRCKVIVKNTVSKAKLVKVTKTDTSLSVTVKFVNKGDDDLQYGEPFWIEKLENNTWTEMKMTADYAFLLYAIVLPGHSSSEKTYTLYHEKGGMYAKEDFTTGKYRIHVSCNYENDAYNYVEFEIE
jgi:hypothetical protein